MTLICKACGTRTDDPARKTRGHFAIELLLWLCLIVPGLIYSIWRLGSRRDCCPSCGSVDLIPADSPLGRRIAQDLPPIETATVIPPRAASPAAYSFGRWLGKFFR